MKKSIEHILAALILILLPLGLGAQSTGKSTVDSTLVGKNIFSVLPSTSDGDRGNVTVNQSETVRTAVSAHVRNNSTRHISGYRVRIYFDNKQTSRSESESVLNRFHAMYSSIPAYRSYANPYFKVTVGDCRTRSEAMQILSRIQYEFPAAFIVKENISYPSTVKNSEF